MSLFLVLNNQQNNLVVSFVHSHCLWQKVWRFWILVYLAKCNTVHCRPIYGSLPSHKWQINFNLFYAQLLSGNQLSERIMYLNNRDTEYFNMDHDKNGGPSDDFRYPGAASSRTSSTSKSRVESLIQQQKSCEVRSNQLRSLRRGRITAPGHSHALISSNREQDTLQWSMFS